MKKAAGNNARQVGSRDFPLRRGRGRPQPAEGLPVLVLVPVQVIDWVLEKSSKT